MRRENLAQNPIQGECRASNCAALRRLSAMLVMLLLANGCSDSKPGARRAASEANLEQVLRQGLEQ
ncbi:MAG: hypothetical protein RBU37_27275, partial [Myxococcota bacterium]|nr:hypothetical protein [Myxococcota bacterium]